MVKLWEYGIILIICGFWNGGGGGGGGCIGGGDVEVDVVMD